MAMHVSGEGRGLNDMEYEGPLGLCQNNRYRCHIGRLPIVSTIGRSHYRPNRNNQKSSQISSHKILLKISRYTNIQTSRHMTSIFYLLILNQLYS